MLRGVKEEEVPGNRNDIVLDPRVTHLHVSLLVLWMEIGKRSIRYGSHEGTCAETRIVVRETTCPNGC